MLYNTEMNWNTITNWTDFGLVHHEDIAGLIEADKALDAYTHEPAGNQLSYLDPKTVVAAVEAKAEQLALREGHNSPLSQAISAARSSIAHSGVKAARENLDHYRDQLTKRFNSAAKRYSSAAELLPETFSAEDLARFTPEVFNAYREAADAAGEITAVRGWLGSLGSLFSSSTDSVGYRAQFLVLDPGNTDNYSKIQFGDQRPGDAVLAAVDPVMLRAVKLGAEFRMATPAERDIECNGYAEALEEAQAQRAADLGVQVLG